MSQKTIQKNKERTFEEYIKDIKALQIQGAEEIAKASMYALLYVIEKSKNKEKDEIIKELKKANQRLIKSRPTEPAMKNSLNYVLNFNDYREFKKMNSNEVIEELIKRINFVLNHFQESDDIISEIGYKKIKKGYIVYTHCHSSTVMRIIKKAWDKGIKFQVYVTETRPHYQGRKTAEELVNYGIPTTYFVDSASRLAIKKSDIMLIGADAITNEGKIINKIGSELISIIANKYDVPVYVCTNSWKFDPETIFGYETPIEEGRRETIWKGAPKKLNINTFLFEKITPELVSGVISEIGIFPPRIFSEEIKRDYSWFFKS